MFLSVKEQWMLIFITFSSVLVYLIDHYSFNDFKEIGFISLTGSILFLGLKIIERKNKKLFNKILDFF